MVMRVKEMVVKEMVVRVMVMMVMIVMVIGGDGRWILIKNCCNPCFFSCHV